MQTVTANIGGIAKFFLMIGEIVSFMYLQNIYLLDLCNSFFNYSSSNLKDNQQINTKKSNVFLAYKERKSRCHDLHQEASLLIPTSTHSLKFSIETSNSPHDKNKKDEISGIKDVSKYQNPNIEGFNNSNIVLNNKFHIRSTSLIHTRINYNSNPVSSSISMCFYLHFFLKTPVNTMKF